MTKTKTISRIQDGGNSNEKSGKGEKIKVKSNASKSKMGGVKDPLRGALGGHPPKLPEGEHTFSHSGEPRPRGALYHPEQAFGIPHGPQTAATTMTLHFNNPGKNALGAVMNTVGQNALPGAKMAARGRFRGNS